MVYWYTRSVAVVIMVRLTNHNMEVTQKEQVVV
jgi:hypothetical protein